MHWLEKLARTGVRSTLQSLQYVPYVRWPGYFSQSELQFVGRHERHLLSAISANVNHNDRALYNLLHAYRLDRQLMKLAGQELQGKAILELGSSPEPTLPLIFLLEGARKFTANNIFPLDDTVSEASVRLLKLLLTSLRDLPATRLDQILTWTTHRNERRARLKEEFFCRMAPVGAEALELPSNSFDVVFSNAVLEHVSKPREVLAKSFELLAPGGWCYHAIDLRDHRNFQKPIEFLRFSEHEWLRESGGSENRLRAEDWLNLFRDVGLRVAHARMIAALPSLTSGSTDAVEMATTSLESLYPYADLKDVSPWLTNVERARLAPPFSEMDLRNLSVLAIVVMAQKP